MPRPHRLSKTVTSLCCAALGYAAFGIWPLHAAAQAPSRDRSVTSTEVFRTITVGGARRSYLVYRPASTPREGMSLVFVFHGGGGTARNIARHTGFTRLAEREGFAVVYPQGINRRWNDGRGIHAAYDDVGFIRALLDTLRRELNVDKRRIFATGISNGAVFVHRLACDLPGAFAAIAPVAGAFPAKLAPRCSGSGAGSAAPTSVMALQGTADRLMPYQGSAIPTHRGAVLSAEHSVALWARINGCATLPVDSTLPEKALSDGTRVRRSAYLGCDGGRMVRLYRIGGGGHTWPGGPAAGASVGRVSREIDATAAIWQFFARGR